MVRRATSILVSLRVGLMGTAWLGYATGAAVLYRAMTAEEMGQLGGNGDAPVMFALAKGRDGTLCGKWGEELLLNKSRFRHLTPVRTSFRRMSRADTDVVGDRLLCVDVAEGVFVSVAGVGITLSLSPDGAQGNIPTRFLAIAVWCRDNFGTRPATASLRRK